MLFLSAVIVLALLHGDDALTQCEKGWLPQGQHCYKMFEEYETKSFAQHSCNFLGAELAYTTDDNLNFLVNLVKKKPTVFGWISGVMGYEEYIDDNRKVPPFKRREPSGSSNCIGTARKTYGFYLGLYMTDVPCGVKLPYICSAGSSKVNVDGNFHGAQNGSNVYWFSSPTDRRTFAEAQKICKAKSMHLLAIPDRTQSDFIFTQLTDRDLNFSNPWWMGLKADDGSFTWNDPDVPMNADLLNWDRDSYLYGPILLLSDGTIDVLDYYTPLKAPYICMRNSEVKEMFGCPKGWTRGGNSCYQIGSTAPVAYDKAVGLCRKHGAHLLSVDSVVEKDWFLKAMAEKIFGVWTSLKETRTPRKWVWTDGSTALPEVVTMTRFGGSGSCVSYNAFTGMVHAARCNWYELPGCQFVPKKGGCYSKNWSLYDGICYYVPSGQKWDEIWNLQKPYAAMLQSCYADLANYTDSVQITPLKITSTGIMNVLNYTFHRYLDMWTGLSQRTDHWADGTTVDYSIFKSDGSESGHCYWMGGVGMFYKNKCNAASLSHPACEKEVPYPGSGNAVTSYFGTQLLMTMSAILMKYF